MRWELVNTLDDKNNARYFRALFVILNKHFMWGSRFPSKVVS